MHHLLSFTAAAEIYLRQAPRTMPPLTPDKSLLLQVCHPGGASYRDLFMLRVFYTIQLSLVLECNTLLGEKAIRRRRRQPTAVASTGSIMLRDVLDCTADLQDFLHTLEVFLACMYVSDAHRLSHDSLETMTPQQ